MTSTRQVIEDAVLRLFDVALTQAKNPRRGYVQAVAPYNGEIDQTLGPEDIREALRGRSPAIFVASVRGVLRSRSIQRRRFNRDVTLELYVVSSHRGDRNFRTRKSPRAQAQPNSDPGVYQLMEDIESRLAGRDLGLDGVAPFLPDGEDPLLQLEDLTAWRLTYRTTTDAHVRPLSYSDLTFREYSLDANFDGDGFTVAEADGSLE